MDFYLNNKLVFTSTPSEWASEIHALGLPPHGYYLTHNGKRVCTSFFGESSPETIHIIPRVLGGKGGFGSMLRAIGAQIEKTTNREACRDLSGRRLRDINEEQRLKNWISTQADRAKGAAERKQKKLERLCEAPKHEFRDEEYDKLRSVLPEKVEDAVTQGLKASCSGTKRKSDSVSGKDKKKKPKLWLDDDIELSSTDGEEETVDVNDSKNDSPKTKVKSQGSDQKQEADIMLALNK